MLQDESLLKKATMNPNDPCEMSYEVANLLAGTIQQFNGVLNLVNSYIASNAIDRELFDEHLKEELPIGLRLTRAHLQKFGWI